MNDEPGEMCAITGTSDAPLTKGEFNSFITRVRFYHLRPLRDDVKEIKHMLVEQDRTMQAHIDRDEKFFNQIIGAKYAIYAICGCLAFLVPLMWKLVEALKMVNVL